MAKSSNINQLENVLNDLSKVDGVNGSLIADGDGNVLSHRMSKGADVSLFGPMAHVITSSSKRLLTSAKQGEIQRVLVESKEGKALFLHLGNVLFIVLMETRANIGLVMISAKKAASQIAEFTKDMIPIISEELEVPIKIHIEKVTPTEKTAEISSKSGEKTNLTEIKTEDISKVVEKVEVQDKTEPTTENVEIELEKEIKEQDEVEIKTENSITQPETELETKTTEPQPEEISEPSALIPIIKPPIAFPELPKDVKVPEEPEERSNLILDIYKAIFLAMSIGASKTMGVAPARGMTKKFLPVDSCKKLLEGVDVKSNSTVDFDKIRENALKIPLDKRETEFINDFSKIIQDITEGYGQVTGYGAFRGMVRAEFKMINDSFGNAMDELGIKGKIHPELSILFE
ncbi:MAG: hypothetical protein FJ150_04540 [Euryarchaeota archaeon]|nr:hypothetical protein [Euryarchaeota archaeon]